ncbi:hypothetical protein [Bacillus phage SDFMU_Pbc]|uniref:Uncharacterized protein n=1 Tax=Bacillus phage SDFMU_Pbc TaxID=3076135 RepID=A0AA96KS13_9CAUD|nr:hypothetical protein [Bacillus phage SDFMU_Pbc]
MKLTELLAQDTITLSAGDQIIANTAAAGYVPTYKDTTNIFQGGYVFQVVESGVANQLNIVPVLITEDGKEQKVEENKPVVTFGNEKVVYITTKNDPVYKDAYHFKDHHAIDVPAGSEARHALGGFLAYAESAFSLGVNNFQVTVADYIKDETVVEEPPTPPQEEEPPTGDPGTAG